MTDATLNTAVLADLLTNAAKYTEDGARSTWTSEEGDAIVFKVRDCSVSPGEMLPSRFSDFYPGRPRPSTDPQGGLGIGLTLVRALVEMHGGTVTAASEGRGKGSQLQFACRSANL